MSKLTSSKAKEMLRDGTANGKKLTSKQKKYFGYVAGGGIPKAANGASISQLSDNGSSNGMIQFNGPSHADGGIPISYAGQPVEVEGNETGFVDSMGDLNVFGNMYMPGTKTKFKTIGKHIAEKERLASKQMDTSMQLITKSDPYDKFERLKFNSGMLMAKGASLKQQDLTQAKEGLALLQQSMLEQDLQKFDNQKAARGWSSGGDGSGGQPPVKKKKNNPWWQNYESNVPSQGREATLPEFTVRPDQTPSDSIPIIASPLTKPNFGPGAYDPGFSNLPAGLRPVNGGNDPGFSMTPAQIQQAGGNPTLAVRHNNPGNIMFAPWEKKYGAERGEPRYDKDGKLIGHFAKFPDVGAGQQAMKALLTSPAYKNLTVADASNKWTGEGAYKNIPPSLRNKKIADMSPEELNQTLDTFTMGEDAKHYNWEGTSNLNMAPVGNKRPGFDVGAGIQPSPLDPVGLPANESPYGQIDPLPTAPNPALPNVNVPPIRPNVPGIPIGKKMPPGTPPQKGGNFNVAKTPWGQIIPEIAALFDTPDFVPGQRYEPNLYQPYQVSFQDQLNENQASFRAIASQVGNNPAAVSVLAGQKYQADSKVLADEFRTNQGITNDITNKNVALLNQAQLTNLQLADTQFVRQSQAKSNTRQNMWNAANSISDKVQKYNLETKQFNALSSLTPQYTFDNNGNLVYIPNTEQSFTNNGGSGAAPGTDAYYQRTRQEYNAAGKLNKTVINTPSDAEQAKMDYKNWNDELKKKATLASYYQTKGFR